MFVKTASEKEKLIKENTPPDILDWEDYVDKLYDLAWKSGYDSCRSDFNILVDAAVVKMKQQGLGKAADILFEQLKLLEIAK